MKLEDIQLCEQYHKGLLDRKTASKFEKDLETYPKLKETYILYLSSIKVIKAKGLREELKTIHEHHVVATERKRKLQYALSGLFLLLLLALCYYFFVQKSTPHAREIMASHFVPYPDVVTIRGEDRDIGIMQYYSNNIFEKVIANADSTHYKSDTILLYFLNSSIAIDDLEWDIDLPILYKKYPSSVFNEQLRWYSALYCLKYNQKDLAGNIFLEIDSTHYKFKDAQRIIDELKLE